VLAASLPGLNKLSQTARRPRAGSGPDFIRWRGGHVGSRRRWALFRFHRTPDLVAERLVRYANLVGRENVLTGTDCGLGTRVGYPSIGWAKFETLAEGARRATRMLWGRS
jgi:hypothetical protein